MPMDETKVEKELKQLKAEIQQLRHTVIGLCIAIIVLAALLFPQVAVAILMLTAIGLIGLLISPARRTVFPYLFRKEKADEP